jgi:hypothetical protein
MMLNTNFTTHSSYHILTGYLILQHIMKKINHDKYVFLYPSTVVTHMNQMSIFKRISNHK